jgi:hypothetical protein
VSLVIHQQSLLRSSSFLFVFFDSWQGLAFLASNGRHMVDDKKLHAALINKKPDHFCRVVTAKSVVALLAEDQTLSFPSYGLGRHTLEGSLI